MSMERVTVRKAVMADIFVDTYGSFSVHWTPSTCSFFPVVLEVNEYQLLRISERGYSFLIQELSLN